MGASFKAIHKQILAYRDIGYGTVHTIRIAMLTCAEKICHREDTWSTWYRDVLYYKRHDDLEVMFTEINLIANDLREKGQTDDWKVLTGIVDFCNHSDCEGCFYECEFIVDAIRKTILTVETPDRIRETMEDLCAVFEKAAEDLDFVEIYRGGMK